MRWGRLFYPPPSRGRGTEADVAREIRRITRRSFSEVGYVIGYHGFSRGAPYRKTLHIDLMEGSTTSGLSFALGASFGKCFNAARADAQTHARNCFGLQVQMLAL